MTAPTCGARTWANPDELITCTLPQHGGDKEHVGKYPDDGGEYTWRDYQAKCQIPIGRVMHGLSPAEARELLGCIQRQLDALEPGAEIAEAEQRMRDARLRVVDLVGITDAHGDDDTAEPEVDAARFDLKTRHGEWIALLRARDAKGGGGSVKLADDEPSFAETVDWFDTATHPLPPEDERDDRFLVVVDCNASPTYVDIVDSVDDHERWLACGGYRVVRWARLPRGRIGEPQAASLVRGGTQ